MTFFYWKRIKLASKFGKIEHKAGRIIALPILVGLGLSIYLKKWTSLFLWGVTFICWLIYLLSHTIEKKLYPKRFR